MTVRVFIVDDHPLLRRGLAQLIEMAGDRGLAMAGEASNGAEALARIESLNPELVVLDLNMPDMNGVEVLQALRERGFSAPVVFLTVSDEQTDFSAASVGRQRLFAKAKRTGPTGRRSAARRIR